MSFRLTLFRNTSLSYAGSVLARNAGAAPNDEIFRKLQVSYEYDSNVTDKLLAMVLETQDDFRMAFDSAKEVADNTTQGL